MEENSTHEHVWSDGSFVKVALRDTVKGVTWAGVVVESCYCTADGCDSMKFIFLGGSQEWIANKKEDGTYEA